MPQIAKDLIGESTGFYDGDHPDRITLNVLHAVDITDVCDGDPHEHKLLKFTRAISGPIVHIVRGGEDGLWNVICHVDQFDFEGDVPDTGVFTSFHLQAKNLGLTSEALLALIKEHVKNMPGT